MDSTHKSLNLSGQILPFSSHYTCNCKMCVHVALRKKSQNDMPRAMSNLNRCTRKHCYAQLDNMVFRENNWYTQNPIDAKTTLIWIRWFCHPHTTITIKDRDDIFIQSYLVLKPPCYDLVTVPACDIFSNTSTTSN